MLGPLPDPRVIAKTQQGMQGEKVAIKNKNEKSKHWQKSRSACEYATYVMTRYSQNSCQLSQMQYTNNLHENRTRINDDYHRLTKVKTAATKDISLFRQVINRSAKLWRRDPWATAEPFKGDFSAGFRPFSCARRPTDT